MQKTCIWLFCPIYPAKMGVDKSDYYNTLLKTAGLKITEARREVIKAFDRQHSALTLKDVSKLLKKSTCDNATVYRTLIQFCEAGVLNQVNLGDGEIRYELNSGDHHHHHVVCRKCHKVEVLHFDQCPVSNMEKLAQKKGYSALSHSFEIFGTCSQCAS